MHSLLRAFAAAAVLLPHCMPGAAQSLPAAWNSSRPSWESSLEAGNGQKVRQEAEALLKKPDIQISPSSYNDQHAKVAILSIAARGAVLDGDWPGAVSLLNEAASTAQASNASASEILENLRKQHLAKISDWRDMIKPQEEQLQSLKGLPGLVSDQIKQVADIEFFLAEHNRAISNSQQSIKDIDEILDTLKAQVDTCTKSLNEWNAFIMKERMDIQEMGSPQRYVAEKLAQIKDDTDRSPFELISYTRRLLKLDPANQPCQQFLNKLVVPGKAAPPPQAAPKGRAPAKR
jgi:chromosome segregation ATPase